MKNLKFVQDRWRDKDDGEYVYECLKCGEKWKLRDPDNAFRGYFQKLSTVDKVTTRLTEKQKLIIGLLIIPGLILIRVIYWLFTN